MENASKALMMAAGVLIGILILTLAVYLFVSFGSASAQLHKEKEEQQIEQFNVQFTSYMEKEEINIYDVVTVANLATENNIYYGFTKRTAVTNQNDNYISVTFKNSSITSYHNKQIEKGYQSNVSETRKEYDTLIAEDLKSMNITDDTKPNLTQYNCEVHINAKTHRVDKVTFTKKT